MFHLGQTEAVIVLVVIFILFGHRLPSVMRYLGRGAIEFRSVEFYERRRWPREPLVNALQMYLIGVGIILVLTVFVVAAGQLLSRG